MFADFAPEWIDGTQFSSEKNSKMYQVFAVLFEWFFFPN